MTFVNSNVLLGLVTDDTVRAGWALERLEAVSLEGPLWINDVVYADLSMHYKRIEALEVFLTETVIGLVEIPRAACSSPARPS